MNPDIEELLGDYIEGTLDAPKRQQVESMLAADAELRKSVQQMMQGRDALRALPMEKAPAQVAGAISSAIAPRPARRWGFEFSAGRLAAALLLAVTLGVVVWSMLPPETPRPIAANLPVRGIAQLNDLRKQKEDNNDAAPMASVTAAPTVQAPAGPVPPAAGEPAQQAFAEAGNNSAMMFVRASDIPAVEREIRRLVGSDQGREVMSNAAPDRMMLEEQGAAAEKPAGRPLAKETKAARPAGIGAPAESLAGAQAPQIRLNNVTPEQVLELQRNVIALSPANRVEVFTPGERPEATLGAQVAQDAQTAPQSQMQARQQQMMRTMPSAAPEDLQQFARMRQEQQLRQSAPAERYDLTIVLQAQPLPPAAPAATLPATAPKPKP